MIYHLLLTLLILDSLVLCAAVLLQSGQGGGLASTFGGVSSSADSIFGSRQAGNLLTKTSWWSGGLFLGLAFLLSLAGASNGTPKSVLDQTFQQPSAPTPVNVGGGGTGGIPLQSAPATSGQPAPATKAPAKPPAVPPGTKKP